MSTNHLDVVDAIKQQLVDRGVSLAGPDGAFAITARVAWHLRDEGAGLLDKPVGNNSHGYATDIICYPSGQIYDVLISGGDVNGPAWQDAGTVDAARYRPPFDPDRVPDVPDVPDPPAGGGKSMMDLAFEGFTKLDTLEARLMARLDALQAQSDAIAQQLTQSIESANAWLTRYEPIILAVLQGLGQPAKKPTKKPTKRPTKQSARRKA